MTEVDPAEAVESVRRFSRFYSRTIGVLQEGLLGSPFSLSEGRVLFELAARGTATASELAEDLGMDAGYLSRILRGFEDRRQLIRKPSESDARRILLSLSAKGRRAFAAIDDRSREEVAGLVRRLAPRDQARLVDAMRTVENLLDAESPAPTPLILRPHRPGDMGWVVQRHGVLYAEEYGWDERFEALVAGIASEFIQRFDSRRERCWIAEQEGDSVGSVFLVRESDEVAKLRLLLVEPKARGLGIGRRLVEECIRFARRAGYIKVTLWTNSVLLAARRIYAGCGFRLVKEEAHRHFGCDLVSETWELELKSTE